MSWLHRGKEKTGVPCGEPGKNDRPFGEPGTDDYWIEVMKRAYQLGEPRALDEIGRLETRTGMHPPMGALNDWFPEWFFYLWNNWLDPITGDSKNRMPY